MFRIPRHCRFIKRKHFARGEQVIVKGRSGKPDIMAPVSSPKTCHKGAFPRADIPVDVQGNFRIKRDNDRIVRCIWFRLHDHFHSCLNVDLLSIKLRQHLACKGIQISISWTYKIIPADRKDVIINF